MSEGGGRLSSSREIFSIFAASDDAVQWVEYTVSLTRTAKTKKPIDLDATLAWRSSSHSAAIAALRRSFASRELALAAVRRVAEERGRKLQRMTQERLGFLEERFNYPAGRSTYLLEAPIIRPDSQLLPKK